MEAIGDALLVQAGGYRWMEKLEQGESWTDGSRGGGCQRRSYRWGSNSVLVTSSTYVKTREEYRAEAYQRTGRGKSDRMRKERGGDRTADMRGEGGWWR